MHHVQTRPTEAPSRATARRSSVTPIDVPPSVQTLFFQHQDAARRVHRMRQKLLEAEADSASANFALIGIDSALFSALAQRVAEDEAANGKFESTARVLFKFGDKLVSVNLESRTFSDAFV